MVKSDWSLKPLYDVIAAHARARERPDEWVVRANHRDGWVFGAWDPLSGQSAMLEEAKAIGALLKSRLAAEAHHRLRQLGRRGAGPAGLDRVGRGARRGAEEQGVLYVNSDTNARGFLHAGRQLFAAAPGERGGRRRDGPGDRRQRAGRACARACRCWGWPRRRGARRDGRARERNARARPAPTCRSVPLGSGSDYTPFLQHLGVASLNLEYGGEGEQGGVYHSHYDTYEHYVRFGDPGFAYGVAAGQDRRAAGAAHGRRRGAAAAVRRPRRQPGGQPRRGEEARRREASNARRQVPRLLDQHAFALAADPTRGSAPPPRDDAVPKLDFAPLDAAVARLRVAASAYDAAYARLNAGDVKLSASQERQLNSLLRGLEQKLTHERGLPGREWFKHFVYAPGLLTGYGVKTLPAVREAIEAGRWAEADEYSAFTAQLLDRYCDALNEATALLRGS